VCDRYLLANVVYQGSAGGLHARCNDRSGHRS
jgi:thymidylate kinase